MSRKKGDWTDSSKKFWWGKKNGKWIKVDASTQKPYKAPKKKSGYVATGKTQADRDWIRKLVPEWKKKDPFN